MPTKPPSLEGAWYREVFKLLHSSKQIPAAHKSQNPPIFNPTPMLSTLWHGHRPYRTTDLRTLDRVPLIGKGLAQRQFRSLLPDKERQKHTYIVGESGSGKSELLKYLFLERCADSRKRSLVLIDPHGDLATELMKKKGVANRDDLVILDPLLDAKKRFSINPFDVQHFRLSPDALDVYAQFLARAFTAMLPDKTSLTLQMETLLIPCFRVLLDRPESTFFDLQRFMVDRFNADLVALGYLLPSKAHRTFFENHFSSELYLSTRHSIATKCQYLLNSKWFCDLLCQSSTVNIPRALRTGKKIIVNLSKGCLGSQTSEALGRFLVAMIAGVSFSRHRQPRALRTPIDLVIDECQLVLSSDIKMILAEGRKFGLHLTLAQQHVGQDMDTHLRDAVLTNTTVKILGGQARTNHAALSPYFY